MEVINKSHEDISKGEKLYLPAFIKFGENNTVSFSAGAVKDFGLTEGMYVNFVNDGNEWWFYCDNNKDGFLLSARKDAKRRQLYVYNGSLISLFIKRTQMSCPVALKLSATKAYQNNCALIKIEINKPLEV